MTKILPSDPTMAQQEAIEREIEKHMCPNLRDVLKWMQIMRLTGHTATDYEHFQWCCSEIIRLRQHIKVLEFLVAAPPHDPEDVGSGPS